MDGGINKIQVRQSESESVRYRNYVCEQICDMKVFLMKIRLVVINWHVCTKKLRLWLLEEWEASPFSTSVFIVIM